MDSSEVLSAFVDGEPVDTAALAAALAAPGSREMLIDFVRLREAVADDGRPAEVSLRRMRGRLAGGALRRLPGLLRIAAALAVVALAGVGVFDLVRGARTQSNDEPPVPTRVIRFEPGVDWKPVEGRQP